MLPIPPERAPDLDDRFAGPGLDAVWTPRYLTHWTTPERAAARYDLGTGGLRLRIDADQPLWRPEDAPLRVSALQSGDFSGPAGSTQGMDRHRPDGLIVRTAQPLRLGFAPPAGRLEITVSASTDPGCMTAAWLRGPLRGWAEELLGMGLPRFHADVDLLLPAADFTAVERFITKEAASEVRGKIDAISAPRSSRRSRSGGSRISKPARRA